MSASPRTGSGRNPNRDVPSSETFHALGSDSRMKILHLLVRGEHTISELAHALDLHTATVRYHLSVLLRDGLIEQGVRRLAGVVGRPTVVYRIRAEHRSAGFPPRQYELLSEILLQMVIESEERPDWGRKLYAAGHKSGTTIVRTLAGTETEWTPGRFVDLVLDGAFAGMGMDTQVVEMDRDRVQYRLFTCPFQELATKYPDVICDHLDVGFHEGIAAALGPDVVHERLSCIGHGNPFCEYRLRWTGPLRGEGA